jgi:hypothetical protein
MPFERTIRRLYLDNLRAHVGEILHGSRPLQIVAETDHLDPVEQRGLRFGLSEIDFKAKFVNSSGKARQGSSLKRECQIECQTNCLPKP